MLLLSLLLALAKLNLAEQKEHQQLAADILALRGIRLTQAWKEPMGPSLA